MKIVFIFILILLVLIIIFGTENSNSIIFSNIYKNEVWGSDGEGSGGGSTIQNTEGIRKIMYELLKENGSKSFVDAPCGSCHWQPLVLEKIPDIDYTGIDVADDVISKNKEKFKDKPNMKFYVGDLSSPNHNIPSGADLILCRDALQHLSHNNIVSALRNFKSSMPKVLLLGSYPGGKNIDIKSGEYFDIDLSQSPYNLKPSKVLSEEFGNKHVYVYYSNDIKNWKV